MEIRIRRVLDICENGSLWLKLRTENAEYLVPICLKSTFTFDHYMHIDMNEVYIQMFA